MMYFTAILLVQDDYYKKQNLPVYKLCVSSHFRYRNFQRTSICAYAYCNDESTFLSILQNFKELYVHRPDVGEQYFYGDVNDMTMDLFRLVKEKERVCLIK